MSLVEEALRKAKAAARTEREELVDTSPVLETGPGATRGATSVATPRVPPVPDHFVQIDRSRLRTAGLLPPARDEHRVATEFRALKRGLLMAPGTQRDSRSGGSKVIMIASALAGEGKSFTAVNLALSLAAERDWTVVLVDADVAKPQLSALLGLQGERGLLDALSSPKTPLSDVTWGTDVAGLHVVPAGHASKTATELLASSRMRDLIGEARDFDRRTVFLFDSPPVLVTSESRALADVVGQIVLVVAADATPRTAVLQAITALGEGRNISLVLNQFKASLFEPYYYGERYGRAESDAV